MRSTRQEKAMRASEAGVSLLELLIASLILIVLATAIIAAGFESRHQIDYEEVRRRAITIGQERFETIRAQFRYDDIVKVEIDTVIVDNYGGNASGTTFTLRSFMYKGYHPIIADSMEDYVKFVSDTVKWTDQNQAGQTVQRKVLLCTYFFREL